MKKTVERCTGNQATMNYYVKRVEMNQTIAQKKHKCEFKNVFT